MNKKHSKKLGKIYLIGGGPGDPELITLKATRILQKADIVFYDYLVNPSLLKWAPQAEPVYVGKMGHEHYLPQSDIEKKLKEAARKYQIIVRLKGGDPFLFGRGGEEAEFLARLKIPFEIIPGVSSALAVPSYAGIPLTHRDFSSELRILTGHENAEPFQVPQKFNEHQTLVILMGVQKMRENFQKIIEQGLPAQTPAAIVGWGTYPKQKTLVGTLKTLPDLAERNGMQAPAIIIVGRVVKLRQSLQWFEKAKLLGKKILVTRSREQASELSQKLQEQGAQVMEFPTIEFKPPRNLALLHKTLKRLTDFNWIFLTSVNAVDFFFESIRELKIDFRNLNSLRFATVGPATSARLLEFGFYADKEALKFTSEALAKSFNKTELSGQKILFPRSSLGQKPILQILQEKGAQVAAVDLYRTEMPKYSAAQLKAMFSELPDVLTFTSSSTVQNLYDLLSKTAWWERFRKIPAVVIGPVTKKRAVELGFNVVKMAKEATIEDLVRVMV